MRSLASINSHDVDDNSGQAKPDAALKLRRKDVIWDILINHFPTSIIGLWPIVSIDFKNPCDFAELGKLE